MKIIHFDPTPSEALAMARDTWGSERLWIVRRVFHDRYDATSVHGMCSKGISASGRVGTHSVAVVVGGPVRDKFAKQAEKVGLYVIYVDDAAEPAAPRPACNGRFEEGPDIDRRLTKSVVRWKAILNGTT